MGLFRRVKDDSPPLLMPDGSRPDPDRLGEMLWDLTYWPSKRERQGIAQVDLDSYWSASYIYSLGIPQSASILAWGDVWFADSRISDYRIPATGVVTSICTVAWWQARPLMEAWVAFHGDRESWEYFSAGVVGAAYGRAIYMGQGGKRELGPGVSVLAEKWGWDKHANRRSTSVIVTAANAGAEHPDS